MNEAEAKSEIDLDELQRRYWDTYGHLDLAVGELLQSDDVAQSGDFSDEEIEALIEVGCVERATP